MFKKILSAFLSVFLILTLFSASADPERETGLFGVLSQSEGADERLAVLDGVAEPVSASYAGDDFSIEVLQAYYEGNRIFVSYRAEGTGFMIQDGLDLEDGSYADIIAGEEYEEADGITVGWKECTVPEKEASDSLTFWLAFGETDESRIGFTVHRHDYDLVLRGASDAEGRQARAELYVGKVDIKGILRLTSPEQAAGWLAWQEGEEETGTDVIGCWNLYQNGEQVSVDLFGASWVDGTDEVVFEMMFPCMEDTAGLTLVPEYSEAGEKPEEAITLEPVT